MEFVQYSNLNAYFFEKEKDSLKVTYYTAFESEGKLKGAHFEIEYI